MMVSIAMITYGHEKYIREAIEGVLMQKCNFPIELVIANDRSPDNTDAIVRDIIANHPNGSWIKYILHPQNLGLSLNFLFVIQESTGKYIAFCEGDDYWTDPLKLQKQVDFLEANPDYSMCFHDAYIVDRDEKPNPQKTYYPYAKEDYDLSDFFGPWFTATASILLRKSSITPLPDWFDRYLIDTLLFTIAATKGKAKLLPGIMSVYRHHAGGVTKSLNYEFWEQYFHAYESLEKSYPSIPKHLLFKKKSAMLYNMTQYALRDKNVSRLKKATWRLTKLCIENGKFHPKFAKIALVSLFPDLYYKFKKN